MPLLGTRLPIPARPIVPGYLRLGRKYLYWWYWDPPSERLPPGQGVVRFAEPTGMLDLFVRIRAAQGVLNFAQRFGVLELCEGHRLPASHNQLLVPGWEDEEGTDLDLWCRPEKTREGLYREPIRPWLRFANRARAMLNIATALRRGSTGAIEDWATLQPGHRGHGPDLQSARLELADLLDHWLTMGNVRLSVSWMDHEPELRLAARTFGVLAAQLAIAVTSAHDLAICTGCGEPYRRQGRKVQAGRRNYCPACGERVANRDRQRAHRGRRRTQRRRRARQ